MNFHRSGVVGLCVTNWDRVALQAPIDEAGNGLDNSNLIDAFRAARIAAAVSEQQQQQQQQGGQRYDDGRFSGAAQQQQVCALNSHDPNPVFDQS